MYAWNLLARIFKQMATCFFFPLGNLLGCLSSSSHGNQRRLLTFFFSQSKIIRAVRIGTAVWWGIDLLSNFLVCDTGFLLYLYLVFSDILQEQEPRMNPLLHIVYLIICYCYKNSLTYQILAIKASVYCSHEMISIDGICLGPSYITFKCYRFIISEFLKIYHGIPFSASGWDMEVEALKKDLAKVLTEDWMWPFTNCLFAVCYSLKWSEVSSANEWVSIDPRKNYW